MSSLNLSVWDPNWVLNVSENRRIRHVWFSWKVFHTRTQRCQFDSTMLPTVSSVRFTIETKHIGKVIDVLNCHVEVNESRKFTTSIHWETTHTDRYLDIGSAHRRCVKFALSLSLATRVENLFIHKNVPKKAMRRLYCVLQQNQQQYDVRINRNTSQLESGFRTGYELWRQSENHLGITIFAHSFLLTIH